ncbi:MAG TPA: cupin domain-containing protein [Vicinamibacterales bacterium]|nr:cupin domain-containing protein [Vicinamibacterales bacterium]
MDDNRREFLAALTGLASVMVSERILAASSDSPDAAAALAPTSKPLAQRATPPINLDGWQMTASEVTYPPGESSGKHRHPGFVIGYVLEGEYRFAVNEQAPTVLKAGQMFFESFDSPNEVHAVSGNASTTQPAKILAIVFTKKGDPVTIPG